MSADDALELYQRHQQPPERARSGNSVLRRRSRVVADVRCPLNRYSCSPIGWRMNRPYRSTTAPGSAGVDRDLAGSAGAVGCVAAGRAKVRLYCWPCSRMRSVFGRGRHFGGAESRRARVGRVRTDPHTGPSSVAVEGCGTGSTDGLGLMEELHDTH